MKPPRGAAAAAPSTGDAWIFASLAARGATTLAQLVARADMLNHAIPTVAEIRSALRVLHARGLVTVAGRAIRLTRPGRAVQASGLARRGGLFSIVENMQKALRSPRFGRAPAAGRLNLAFVTRAALDRAYAQYAADAA